MSTTTILEPYDTQMLDYLGDVDVQMHTAGMSSDSWPHGEAKMDDDTVGHHLHAHTTPFSEHESVEVDMEPYDGDENPEYEMADEVETYPQDGELVDVEVYDASEAHSPAPVPEVTLTPSNALVDLATTSPAFPSIPNISSLPIAPEEPPASAPEHNDESSTSPEYVHHVPLSSSPQPDVGEIAPDAASTHVVLDLPNEHASETIDELHGVDLDASPSVSVRHPGEVPHADDHNDHEGDAPEETEASLQGLVQSDRLSEYAKVDVEAPSESQHVSSADHEDKSREYDADAEATADPHEISEGVYIDPPPAVLVSFPSSGHPEFCLFNHPGSSTPSPGATQTEYEALTLLLHHRPTLYYEPVSNVFEALREEPFITQLPDFGDGELVLDAYDLQLVIPEDNAYAREVTLHDLNVLHDGSDLSGPLRVQLRLEVPRFIIRYHSLRDQISRLNLAAEDGGIYSEIHDEEHQHHEDGDQHGHEIAQEQTQEPRRDLQEYQESQTEQNGDPQAPYHEEDHHEGTIGDLSHLNTENPEYHEVGGETAHALEDENEYTDPNADATVVAADEAEGNLDADAIHDTADAAASTSSEGHTQYEEYTEAREEDDEIFGEALPEDFGGRVSALGPTDIADNEESAAVDYPQDPLPEPEIAQEVATIESHESHQEESLDISHEREPPLGSEQDSEDTYDNPQGAQISELQTPSSALSALHENGLDESDSNFVAMLERAADQADPLADPPNIQQSDQYEKVIDNPEDDDVQEWDDSLDGEGEIDPTWAADPDVVSNQSSTTLSSTSRASKRVYDEVEPEDEQEVAPPSSPDSKRARVG